MKSIINTVYSCALLFNLLSPTTLHAQSQTSSLHDSNKINKKIDLVENGLKTRFQIKGHIVQMNILDRMKHYHIPGVSITVINHGKVEWSKVYNLSKDENITPNTLFQAASISKPLAAIIALSLAENATLNLDVNVNDVLNTWKVPDNQYTEKEKVTLRRLLSHSSGLSVHGFLGYPSSLADSELPNTTQILNGELPANSVRVEPFYVPGTAYSYSGGGYVVMQKILQEVTEIPFSELAQKIVFKPLGMKSSTFEVIRPGNTEHSYAIGHSNDGTPVPGNWNLYPETAPAGLWTTPTELAKFIIDIQHTLNGKSKKIISKKMMLEMLTKQPNSKMGLGLKVKILDANIIEFSHGGSNIGYKADMLGFTKIGKGVVIMTNADNGYKIIPELERSVADAYHWPEGYTDQYRIIKPAKVDPAIYKNYVGEFAIENSESDQDVDIISLFVKDNRLFITLPFFVDDNKTFELTPESEKAFFNISGDFEISFVKDNNDELTIEGMKAHRVNSDGTPHSRT